MSQEELRNGQILDPTSINQLKIKMESDHSQLKKVISALELTPEEFFNFDSLEALQI